MKQYDLKLLIEKSDLIQRFCINEKSSQPGNLHLDHHLPLKNPQGSCMNTENWDLPIDIRNSILSAENLLLDYAKDMINLSATTSTISPWLLPPWVVFPLYGYGSSSWKMGLGSIYVNCFNKFYNNLSEAERSLYDMNYEKPEYFS